MTPQEVNRLKYTIDVEVKKTLSQALQRLVNKKESFICNETAFMDEIRSIAKDYGLSYIEENR